MTALVESPRERARALSKGRYPGLTLEERGYDPAPITIPPASPEPPPPLWVAPSDIPRPARALGFVAALPETEERGPPAPEGLFDVPGLLERLWLARALEAGRDRTTGPARAQESEELVRMPTPPDNSDRSGGATTEAASTGVGTPGEAVADPPREGRSDEPATHVAPPTAYARSWVCPWCYLANDAGATVCRGCRASVPQG